MKKIGHIAIAFAMPLFAFAAASSTDSLYRASDTIIGLINNVAVPLVFALAFIVFIWGIFQYFIQGGHDEEAKEKGKSLMLWGLIGFFVMISVWGLVHIFVGTFTLDTTVPLYPHAPLTPGGG